MFVAGKGRGARGSNKIMMGEKGGEPVGPESHKTHAAQHLVKLSIMALVPLYTELAM